MFCRGSITLISILIAHGETVRQDEATDTLYGHLVWTGMIVLVVVKAAVIFSS
jgi:hypothetical protein